MTFRFSCLVFAASMASALWVGGASAQMAKAPKSLEVLAPEPIDGGATNKAELAELHRLIAATSPERLAKAKWDDDHEDPSLFYETIGGGFDLKTLPATAALLAVVMNDESFASSSAKRVFARKRPWVVDPSIVTCDPNDKPLTSYPSGHAMVGYSVGVILAALMPDKAPAIQARAADFALSREICGSHYPSDIEASHVLGAVVAVQLLNSPALQPKIAAARAELRAARFTGG